MAKRTAVIDIGSNSARMVIYEKSSRYAFHLIHESRSRVRISEGAYNNGSKLQKIPMQRALFALKEFVSIASSHRVNKILCVATSALRDASNKKEFLKQVKAETSLKIKIIDGEREAYLGAVAATNLLPPLQGLTLDIGGGSTDFSIIDNSDILSSNSYNLGSIRIKELFLDEDRYQEAKAYIGNKLDELSVGKHECVIGIGGTFRSLAQIIQKRADYPLKKLHGFTFKSDELLDLCEEILTTPQDRLSSIGIKKERYDSIKSGVLILSLFLQKVECKRVVTSGVGVREGLYLSDLLRHNCDRFPHNYNPSLRYLLDKHTVEQHFTSMMHTLTSRLFDTLHEVMDIDIKCKNELLIAAKLVKVGASIHTYSYSKRGHYIILNALEYGYTHEQIATIATLVRSHKSKHLSKTSLRRYGSLLSDLKTLEKLRVILALSNALLSHRPRQIDCKLSLTDKRLHISSKSDLYLAREQIKALDLHKQIDLAITTL